MTVVIIIAILFGAYMGVYTSVRRQKVLNKVACPTCHTVGRTRHSTSRTLIIGGTLKTMHCGNCSYRW